jgi:hypothetical protein
LVEKPDCCRVLGILCHSSGFCSLSRSDVLLFICQEACLLGRYLASTPAHMCVCMLPRARGSRQAVRCRF